jgi:hypothetical protein
LVKVFKYMYMDVGDLFLLGCEDGVYDEAVLGENKGKAFGGFLKVGIVIK